MAESGDADEASWTTTSHARWQMRRRGVSEAAIGWVLRNYDGSRPAPPLSAAKPAVILSGEYQGRRLKVYVERDSDPPKIKTVVWEGD